MFLFSSYLIVGLVLSLLGLQVMNDGGPPIKLRRHSVKFTLVTTLLWLPALLIILLYTLYEKTANYLYPEDPVNPEDYGC